MFLNDFTWNANDSPFTYIDLKGTLMCKTA